VGRNLLRLRSEVFFKYSNANKQLSPFKKELEYILTFMSSSYSICVTFSVSSFLIHIIVLSVIFHVWACSIVACTSSSCNYYSSYAGDCPSKKRH